MNCRLVLLVLAAAFSGCASFDKSELAQVRQRGVSADVARKLDRGEPVTPADVIELTRRGVPDAWITRQIEDHDVDSVITRSDIVALRRAGVRSAVVEAMSKASDRFAGGRYYAGSWDSWYYDDPYMGFYDPYPVHWYGAAGAGFIVSPHRRHHH
jgi:hypothetical protein